MHPEMKEFLSCVKTLVLIPVLMLVLVLSCSGRSGRLSRALIINPFATSIIPVILTFPFKRKRLFRNFKLHRIAGERIYGFS